MLNRANMFIVLAVILSLIVPGIALAKDFPDVSAGHWGQKEIQGMSDLGFITGNPDGKFYPDNPVTRAQFAAIIVKSLKLPVNAIQQPTFKDVSKKHWALGVIEAASKAGFIMGNQGLFRPEDMISRQEMGVIVMKISEKYGYAGDGSTAFLGQYRDSAEVSQWAAAKLSDAAKFGYIEEFHFSDEHYGVQSAQHDRVLAPLNAATRAQASVAVYRVLVKTGLI